METMCSAFQACRGCNTTENSYRRTQFPLDVTNVPQVADSEARAQVGAGGLGGALVFLNGTSKISHQLFTRVKSFHLTPPRPHAIISIQ